jgi:acetyltransferase-like isoleucine patch superfamily enzyme
MGQIIRKLAATIYRRYFAGQVESDIKNFLLYRPVIFGGDDNRVSIAPTAKVMNALFNVSSGTIIVGEDVFFGHNVCLITGTHDERKNRWPDGGHDIVLHEGVWVGSNVTILGPCVIGADAVIAAGSLVRCDVPRGAMVAGVPARVVKQVV